MAVFTAVFVWFFKAVNLIDHLVTYCPSMETPIYLCLSVLPIWLSRSNYVEMTMRDTLDGLAYFTSSPVKRHMLKSLWKPLSGIIDAIITFLGVNLIAQSVTEDWQMVLPDQWKFLDPNGDGILEAAELEGGIGLISQRVLYAVAASYVVRYFLSLKRPPEDFKKGSDGWEESPGLVTTFWKGMVMRRGLYVLLNLTLDAVAVVLAGFQWLKVVGLDPVTVLTFGGIGGIAFGLASQSLLTNIISGILLLVTRPFSTGDYIETSDIQGEIIRVGWVFTEVQTLDGPRVSVPNSSLNESLTTNRTAGENRVFKVNIPVRFPEGRFGECRSILEGLEDTLQELSDGGGLRDGEVLFTKRPGAALKGMDTSMKELPVPMIEIEITLGNGKTLGEIDDVQSECQMAALSYVRGRGCEIPGLEY